MMIWLLITSTLLGTADAFSKVIGPVGPVVGLVGGDVRLPCRVESGESVMDDEVIWKTGDKTVHRYYRHTDRTDQQPPEYRGRTSESREALRRGDLSLTLTNLRLSDAGTYSCLVRADTWSSPCPPVTVKVETVSSTPSVSAVSLGDGRVRLQCESTGWSTEPQLHWLTSRGQQLPADPMSFQRFPSGLRVTSNITVEETHGSNFTCMMTSAAQRRVRTVEVPQADFGTKRERHRMTAAFGSVFGVTFAVALAVALRRIKAAWYTPNGGPDVKNQEEVRCVSEDEEVCVRVGGADLEELRCVLEEQEVCVYRQGHLEVSSDTHTLPSGGTCLTLIMTKEMIGHPMNSQPPMECVEPEPQQDRKL